MEGMWLRRDTSELGWREGVGFVKNKHKSAKEIQSSLTFTGPKAVQGSGSWAVKERVSPNTLSAYKSFFISPVCPQDNTSL